MVVKPLNFGNMGSEEREDEIPHADTDIDDSKPAYLTMENSMEELTQEEHQEKARLIAQVLELQNTLDELSCRVDGVKEENLRLRSENQVLGQYIENLMAASNVFNDSGTKWGQMGQIVFFVL